MFGIRDLTLQAVYAGFLAVIVKDAVDWICRALGITKATCFKIASGAFFAFKDLNTTPAIIVGYTAHYTAGAILGVLFLLLLVFSGKEHGLQKGILFGLGVWLLLAGPFLTLGVSTYVPADAGGKLMLLIDHIVFGIALGIMVPRFVLRNKHPNLLERLIQLPWEKR